MRLVSVRHPRTTGLCVSDSCDRCGGPLRVGPESDHGLCTSCVRELLPFVVRVQDIHASQDQEKSRTATPQSNRW